MCLEVLPAEKNRKEKKESTKVYPYEAEEHPVSGQTSFTVLSPPISNKYARKKGIAKKLILTLRANMILKKLNSLQVISMVQRGDVAAETTSVLLTKY